MGATTAVLLRGAATDSGRYYLPRTLPGSVGSVFIITALVLESEN